MPSNRNKTSLTQSASIQTVELQELLPDPANLRRHTDANREAVDRSIRAFGAGRSIVCDGNGVIRAGNQTLESAKQAGIKQAIVVEADGKSLVVVKRKDWTPAQAIAYAIADNRSAELAEWETDDLTRVLQAIQEEEEIELIDTGFTEEDLAELLSDPAGPNNSEVEEVPIPEPPDAAITKPGDIWVLGEHRLMCGDSGSPADLDRLLASGGISAIDLVNMDPPYNVKVEPRSNNAIAAGLSSFAASGKRGQSVNRNEHAPGFVADPGRDVHRNPNASKATTGKLRAKDRPLANDFVKDGEFDEMLLAWFGNASRVLRPGGSFYIWGGYANIGNYPAPLKACGLYFSQAIIWDKQHPVLTRKDFMGAHELAFYGWKEGAGHKFYGPNNATDLWHVKKVNPQSMVHLTEKPVELAARAIEYSSKKGNAVLDLFGGSGSTMMAAEQLERRAFLMELDPLYCDVIIKRWEEFTGRKAELFEAKT